MTSSLTSYDSGFYKTLFFSIVEVASKVYKIRLFAEFLNEIAEIDLKQNKNLNWNITQSNAQSKITTVWEYLISILEGPRR